MRARALPWSLGAWLAIGSLLARAEPAAIDPASASPVASVDSAGPAGAAAVLALDPASSTSLGGPSDGSLRGGVALPQSGPGFSHNPRRPAEARYASVELVQAIVRAAAVVERELPGSSLVVNDLGLSDGGPIRQHGSHQAGRDADILFYALDAAGDPMPAVGVPVEPNGRGWDFKDLANPDDDVVVRIDLPRTWRFVHALLEAAGDDVQRIFLAEHLREMLLAQAKRAEAPKGIVTRFAQVTCQPGSPHDDHMHVRLHCSAQDMAEGCLDSPPVYPWRRQALAALGLEPAIASPARTPAARREVRARTTTPAQARQRAGRMHWKVRKFLERRKAWQDAPHPGRPYCR